MNWRDTLIKNKDIQWKHPKIKYIEDGKVDMILTIPFTNILEQQAKLSFLKAINDYHHFVVDLLTSGDTLDNINYKLKTKLQEYGFN